MSRYLAIDADSHGLLVVAANLARDAFTVERVIAATDLAQPLSPSNAALIGQRIKSLLAEQKVAAAPALVVVGRDRILLKDVKHPPVSAMEEPSVVRFQALKEVEGADDLVLDYVPQGSGLERRASVALLKKDHAAAVKTMCDAAGLKLAAITPRPYAAVAALARADVPPPQGAVAIVVLHEAGGEFTVAQNGAVLFTRPIPLAAVATEAAFVQELRRNLASASMQAGDAQAIYLSEAESRGENWAKLLRSELGLPVYAFDPLAGFNAGTSVPAELHGRFLGPVGLLAARLDPVLPINFAQPRQPRRSSAGESPLRKRLLIAAIAGILLLGGLGITGWILLDSAETRVATLRNQINDADEKLKRGELDAKRVAAVEEFSRRNMNWLDEYYEQSARFPDIRAARLTYFDGSILPLPTEKDRQSEPKVPAKNAPPKRIGNLHMTVQTGNRELASSLTDALHRESKYYLGTTLKVPASGGSTAKTTQSFTIDTGLAYRSPADYVQKLVVPKYEPPPAPAPEKKAETPMPVVVPPEGDE